MRVVAWRIFKPRHASTAFTGEGARLYGGRWNSKGVPLVYAAGSQSLAALELLVHLASAELLGSFQVAAVAFDEQLVERLDPSRLPTNWRQDPAPLTLRDFGDEWARKSRSAALRVPSALVPDEFNYLLNPAHPDFSAIVVGRAVPFRFDPRLIK